MAGVWIMDTPPGGRSIAALGRNGIPYAGRSLAARLLGGPRPSRYRSSDHRATCCKVASDGTIPPSPSHAASDGTVSPSLFSPLDYGAAPVETVVIIPVICPVLEAEIQFCLALDGDLCRPRILVYFRHGNCFYV